MTDEQISLAKRASRDIYTDSKILTFDFNTFRSFNLEYEIYSLPIILRSFEDVNYVVGYYDWSESRASQQNIKSRIKNPVTNGEFPVCTYGFRNSKDSVISIVYSPDRKELYVTGMMNGIPMGNILKDYDDPFINSDNIPLALEYFYQVILDKSESWENHSEII